MPVFDTIRRSLFSGGAGVETFRCEACGADFSMTEVDNAATLECPYCGAGVEQSPG